MKYRKSSILILLMIGFIFLLQSISIDANGQDTLQPQLNKARLTGVIVSESILAGSSLTGLYYLWYDKYPKSGFHFFNDNKEWLMMDKIGHATTGYYLGKIGYDLLKWSGVDERKSIWYGGTIGFGYLTIIEIMDGFSAEWGTSTADFAANSLGSALFVGQQLFWKEQRLLLKWSYSNTEYAKYRPNVLGSKLQEKILKDYNGQTYWLSANLSSFLPSYQRIPKWLCISFGYGADGMIGGHFNPEEENGTKFPHFNRRRQFYLSADIDLTRIKTNNKTLKLVFEGLGFLKIPFPTLEYHTQGSIKFHPFYF